MRQAVGGALVYLIAFLMISDSVLGQSDPFGSLDLVYGDSVSAQPGQEVSVSFSLRNDESLGSLAIPLSFDTSVLTLKMVSFENSRVDYISTKIFDQIDSANAHGNLTVAIIRLFEEAIPPGDGMLFSCSFVVSPDALRGDLLIIDSTFIPPAGELILGEATTASGIYPAFTSGKIKILEENRTPFFTEIGDQTNFEGDSIVLHLSIIDPDDDSLSVVMTEGPVGSILIDNGNGTAEFLWSPEYIGPQSSEGSPFALTFRATDGSLSADKTIALDVINKNRAPIISAPQQLSLDAGDAIQMTITASDPDFDSITWRVLDKPTGSSVDLSDKAVLNWQPSIAETGNWTVEIMVTDESGLADTSVTLLSVNPVDLYTLKLDTVEAYSGEELTFALSLDNRVPVGGFDLVIHYDPSALVFVDGINTGTRSEGFEQFEITTDVYNIIGHVRITGEKSLTSNSTLSAGDGPIAIFRFRVSENLSLSGQSVPVNFATNILPGDNTLTDSVGMIIPLDEIVTADGRVQILDFGNILIGDLNLNGLAAEISDVITYTNYFINPTLYPLNPLQFANSDINGDNLAATIADLIALIRIVVEGSDTGFKTSGYEDLFVPVWQQRQHDRTVVMSDNPVELGGLFVHLKSSGEISRENISVSPPGMDYEMVINGNDVKMIMYSWDGIRIPEGKNELILVDVPFDVEIADISFSSFDGRQLVTSLSSAGLLVPDEYHLDQNYPNPFNPTTVIKFGLPIAVNVRLSVFNILGQNVAILVDGMFPAGEHVVEWDGQNSNSQQAASGIYFYRLSTGERTITRKMLLMK